MKRLNIAQAGVWLVILGAPRMAAGTPFDNKPKILLHVHATTLKSACTFGQLTDCRTANVRAGLSTNAGPYYFVYLLAARGNLPSVGGLSCGVTYQGGSTSGLLDGHGIDVFEWRDCGAFYVPVIAWPAPGGGIVVVWTLGSSICQYGEVAVAGYFYLGAYSADTLRVTPYPPQQRTGMADCGGEAEADLRRIDLGYATFSAEGNAPGCNPCVNACPGTTPAAKISWGQVKSLYSGN